MSAEQHSSPATIMTSSRTTFKRSNSAAAMEGETMSGCSRPTTVLLTLVTARRLGLKDLGGGGVGRGEGGVR
jgi:hypothetical protein